MGRALGRLLGNGWLVAFGGGYVGLRIWSFAGIAGHASAFPDTRDYIQAERLQPWTLDFWTWYKPWGTPLLWKLVPGRESTLVPIVQWTISVAAWLVLAAVVYWTLERREVRYAGFVAVLVFSLTPAIAVWDGALLSESFSLSLSALLVAAMFVALRKPTWGAVALLLVVSLWLAGTRTTNGYLTPFLLIPIAIVLGFRSRRVGVAMACGAVAIAGLSYARGNVREWEVPLGEIVAGRVLHDPAELHYFTSRGMPVYAGLDQDIYANRSPEERFEAAPSLKQFLPWFNSRARSVYAGYLVDNIGSTVADPVRHLGLMVSPSSSTRDIQALPLRIYAASGYRDALPGPVRLVAYVSSASLLLAWTVAAGFCMVGFALAGLWRRSWWVALIVVASTIPHALIVWTGDDLSLGRHGLLLAVFLRLGLIVLTVQLVDVFTVRSVGTAD